VEVTVGAGVSGVRCGATIVGAGVWVGGRTPVENGAELLTVGSGVAALAGPEIDGASGSIRSTIEDAPPGGAVPWTKLASPVWTIQSSLACGALG
jgi:hypothetical protein